MPDYMQGVEFLQGRAQEASIMEPVQSIQTNENDRQPMLPFEVPVAPDSDAIEYQLAISTWEGEGGALGREDRDGK
jgi:hypothetical protein